ncbi:MAG TPA: 6,7-dimethyl-8-ribityllumazine synthase, partial [Haliscomenobacter sp.]|uniref:6,7-dimethyl-8-ribityllumazine synthase n=1 Tax=Haliscomenobacter sp. TaxID=2717303 RepID=UPI001D92E189|nr:6,7-dimethyl-8-ribityllumazine synthase [Haliscomenobacter sp.]MBK9488648.1 6,7-dimethyl-8-ribityllumazine synthase [Haliscomenobacter sp.]HOY19988.1 6,7-dimethyl-8-ribityllumazine synthase [Haliscomenobacter sp.]HPH18778.1 6,7-dimethyl-8-ribityllumazine synthase [Haliscomenobacter sp.]
MASALKNLSQYDETTLPSAADLRFGIVVADWNAQITHALYQGCLDTLLKHGAKEENIHMIQVPGSFELPAGARLLAGAHKLDAIIAIGCVIKGETNHNEYINNSVALGLTNLGVATNIPCIFGVLTPNDEQQALDRAGGKHGNKGIEAGVTAIRMAALKQALQKGEKGKIGF